MRGDALASGNRSATFGPAKVSQKKWDGIWETPKSLARRGLIIKAIKLYRELNPGTSLLEAKNHVDKLRGC
jgi:ribosomal protein L7/L12